MNPAGHVGYAIIGGSGFADFAGDARRIDPTTRYGRPSAPLRVMAYGDHDVYYLARHGERHDIPPHRINYRANLAALATLGIRRIVALNTVGVITGGVYPGQLAVPDQLIDYTWGRAHSIHGDGTLEHIDFSYPFTDALRRELLAAADAAGVDCRDGGVYGVTQGPRLETAAEVDRYERDSVDYLGMTAMPEAALARELDMEYACLSLIVNRAAGRGEGAIHDDIEASTMTAKMQAMKVLLAFFGDRS